MTDYISREAALREPERYLRDCNPEHFDGQPKFIKFMDDPDVASFGQWQFANGFNMGLTAAEVGIKNIPAADVVEVIRCVDCSHFVAYEEDDYWCKWWGESPDTTYGYCHAAERREP